MPTVDELKQAAVAAIDQRKDEIVEIAKTVLANPETGFTEQKTARLVQEKFKSLGIPFRSNLAITGVKGVVEGGAGTGPSVSVIGELDSLRVLEHPYHDEITGAAHACGHHAQIGNMLGAMIGIMVPDVLKALSGRIIPFAVPAEEFIEVERRMLLRDEGKIEFMGGKQELIQMGEFGDIDMAMMCHTSSDRVPLTVGGTSNAHIVKYVEFIGRGSHAGGSPHLGINALNAAVFALSAVHANRETFRDQDVVRVHGIITHGGEAVSAVPANVTLEWRVRSGNLQALEMNSAKVDRSFKAGAMAVGAKVRITNIPGYMPLRNDPIMQDIFKYNAVDLLGKAGLRVRNSGHNGGGSTDMGDLSQIIPVIHPYCGGATGTGHGKDYLVQDYDISVVNPAKAMAMTVIDLLANGAEKAKEVVDKTESPMTKDKYVNSQRKRAEVIEFDGAKA